MKMMQLAPNCNSGTEVQDLGTICSFQTANINEKLITPLLSEGMLEHSSWEMHAAFSHILALLIHHFCQIYGIQKFETASM